MVFMHTAWMERYDGEDKTPPRCGGSFVEENGWGGEMFNFRDEDGLVYGYACGKGHRINIDRLGANPDDEAIDGVLVIWTATGPGGGVLIVGWYENATVYREYRTDPELGSRVVNSEVIMYSVVARSEDAWLIPPEMRAFRVKTGKGWKGQSNVWYADGPHHESFRNEVLRYVATQKAAFLEAHRPLRDPCIHSRDRREVERIAVQTVTDHFRKNGYSVRSVESDNVGWDLEAARGRELLLLEVKGLAGDNISVQLTPNEYEQMIRHRSEYRVCVVTGAGSAEPSLWVFADVNEEWRSLGRRKTKLQVTERTGAILSEVHLTDSAECAGCE
jgi:hypothetical protein